MDLEPFVMSLSLFGFFFGLFAVITLAYAPGPIGIGLVVFICVAVIAAVAVRALRRGRV